MSRHVAQILEGLWDYADHVYKSEMLIYFVCPGEYSFRENSQADYEILEDELPDSYDVDTENMTVYSFDYRPSQCIFEIGGFINTKLPLFLDKESGDFKDELEKIILYKGGANSEINKIDADDQTLVSIIRTFNLLKQTASYISQEDTRFSFWMNSVKSDGKSSSLMIDFTFDSSFISSLHKSKKEIRLPSFEGPHAQDKIVIFKRAVIDFFSNQDSVKASTVLENIDKIDAIFDSEFIAYVNKFGLDKSLNELYDKLNDIIGKIFEAIHGTTLKLLIVPATMLATIFMRQRGESDLKMGFILVAVGALIILLHSETKRYINNISQNGQRLLDTIISINTHETDNDEIRTPQKNVKDELDGVATDAKKRVTRYLWGSALALALWGIIILGSELPPYMQVLQDWIMKLCSCSNNS
ncbi:hypothetical protein CWE09_04595 [Aliidiomarina minuta]|uniref:Uncharacterized protein n=1 Tax=Aliidiomarina minuta TaxID=880057 RepID=A0A432W7E8_9GAMM|nr:hypothetical protein [Aliidiomarina minuta]RUO26010.1 hypothetical protein CWE09_04595 [Aliidiomarina minuta]